MAGNPSPGLHVLCLTKTFIDVRCVLKQKDPSKVCRTFPQNVK